MEIKYTIMLHDEEGTIKTLACEMPETYMKKLLNVLLAGADPNNINDIVIRPVIKK